MLIAESIICFDLPLSLLGKNNIDFRDNGEDHGRGECSIHSLSRHTGSSSAYIGQLHPISIFSHYTAITNAIPETLLPPTILYLASPISLLFWVPILAAGGPYWVPIS